MVFVTFEELKKGFLGKVITIMSARFRDIDESVIEDAFNKSVRLAELRIVVRNKFGGNVPFLEIDRLEDQFLVGIIDNVHNELQKFVDL